MKVKVKEKIKKFMDGHPMLIDDCIYYASVGAAVFGIGYFGYCIGDVMTTKQIEKGIGKMLSERVLLLGDPDNHVIFNPDEEDLWLEVLKRKGLVS